MDPSRERLRLIAQIVLVVVAALAAAGAAWRYQATRISGDPDRPEGPAVIAIPPAGPVGLRPLVELSGFEAEGPVRVLFCAAGADDAGCAEIGQGRPDERIRTAALPAKLTVAGQETTVVPGAYELRAVAGEADEPLAKGAFDVIPFSLGDPPQATSFAGIDVSMVRLGDGAEVARTVACDTRFTPDNRLILGSVLLDHRTALSVDLRITAAELAWSPSRDRLAMITKDRKELRMAAPDGSGPDVVVREARGLLSSLTWSPHSDRIAFVVRGEPGVRGGPSRPTVRILDLTTGEQTPLIAGEWASWSPTGDRLAVEVVEGSGRAIMLAGLDGNASRLVDGRRPSWSPDGRFVAFIRQANGGAGLIVRADSPVGAALASGGVCGMAFAPDGRWMSVVIQEGDQTRLMMRPIETVSRSGR